MTHPDLPWLGVPPEQWLRAGHFARTSCHIVRAGARQLVALPRRLRSLMPTGTSKTAREMSCCSFLQLQSLQRGAEIRPHLDAASPTADVVGTLGVLGEARIRVGAVEVDIREGDAYLLSGPARWDVKHEVSRNSSLRSLRSLTTVRKRWFVGVTFS